jgi:peroxiredoxin
LDKSLATAIQIGFIGLAAVAVYSFVSAARADLRRSACAALCILRPAYAGANRRAPDFELPDLDGHRARLSSFRGKTVFLNFWTKACAPCLEEMPSLAALARIAAQRTDFVVLTVCTDSNVDEIRDAAYAAAGGKPPFTVLIDADASVVKDRYGTRLYPETWVVDPSGIIRARFDGARDWSTALAVELGKNVSMGVTCPFQLVEGQAIGAFANACDDG